MRTFRCACESTLFFENTTCGSCGRTVGWCPSCRRISALEACGPERFRCLSAGCGATVRRCANYAAEGVCNRCIDVNGPRADELFCDCCRLNVTIPDLSVDGNRVRWARLEAAKRRLIYALDALGLPYGSAADGFAPPLAFAFKGDIIPAEGLWRTMGEVERVYTGHADGQITINIREADDVEREKLRVDFGEAHRTLIGHFRHEIGHYFWDVLIRDRDEEEFKTIFGDHMALPYDRALAVYYKEGPPVDWARSHVSAYATMHPWEDWAETFALYLAMASQIDTAFHLGLIAAMPTDFDGMAQCYRRLGLVLNELSREMGLLDVVPVVITAPIHEKLAYLHKTVRRNARGR